MIGPVSVGALDVTCGPLAVVGPARRRRLVLVVFVLAFSVVVVVVVVGIYRADGFLLSFSLLEWLQLLLSWLVSPPSRRHFLLWLVVVVVAAQLAARSLH